MSFLDLEISKVLSICLLYLLWNFAYIGILRIVDTKLERRFNLKLAVYKKPILYNYQFHYNSKGT